MPEWSLTGLKYNDCLTFLPSNIRLSWKLVMVANTLAESVDLKQLYPLAQIIWNVFQAVLMFVGKAWSLPIEWSI